MSNQFSVGSAAVDITPPLQTHLTGNGNGMHRPTKEVLNPLYATAIVFESGEQRACMIVTDLTMVCEPYTREVRRTVAKQIGTTPEAVIISATQTHSAPSLGAFMLDKDFSLYDCEASEYLRGSEQAYVEFVMPKIVQAATEAFTNRKPTQLTFGRGVLGDYTFNRRGIHRDGKHIIMPKPFGAHRQEVGPTDLAYLEGPIDPEVGVMQFHDGESLQAIMLHHTCHPVISFGKKEEQFAASADWCGAWANQLRKAINTNTMPMVVNGCCGNINPWHPYDPDFTPCQERMGAGLTAITQKILGQMNESKSDLLAAASCRIPLTFRDIPEARLAEVEKILSDNPKPVFREDGSGVDPTWFFAASTRSVELQKKRETVFDLELQAIRIGDAVVVGIPGEPFVECQLAIKSNSPAAHVQVAHMSAQYIGYLPTREACERFGHESNAMCTYWAKFSPGSMEQVVDAARGLVDGLFATSSR